jgi:excisionase family DNA binding protein
VAAAESDLTALVTQIVRLVASNAPEPPAPAPRQMPDRVMLTVEEAAKQLRIGRTSAYRLVRTGELESVLIGRLRRVPAAAVHEYAKRLLASQKSSRPAA